MLCSPGAERKEPRMAKASTNLGSYGYLPCRHYLHAWNELGAEWLLYENVKRKGKYWRSHNELVLATPCYRCNVVRHDRYNPRSHEFMGRQYKEYPPGYLQERGSGLKKRDYTAAMLDNGVKKAKHIEWEVE